MGDNLDGWTTVATGFKMEERTIISIGQTRGSILIGW